MDVLLVGNGKMGKFIKHELLKNENVTSLTVCDIKYDESFTRGEVKYVPNLEEAFSSVYDCAFIATPAVTHCEVLEQVIAGGVKNVYVEKPAVLGEEERRRIEKIKGDRRIATGYILRQSAASELLREKSKELFDSGYRLELCSVSYQKFLPVTLEERAWDDLGVFDETVHVWDLLFNFLGLNRADIICSECLPERDRGKPERYIAAKLSYLLSGDGSRCLVNVNASFKAAQKRREFFFTFKNPDGERQNLLLAFDGPDGNDRVEFSNGGGVYFSESFPAFAKLRSQTDDVFTYFRTGDRRRLALLEDSKTVNELVELAGVRL